MAVTREQITAADIIRERGLTKPEDLQRAVELADIIHQSLLNPDGSWTLKRVIDRAWDVDTAYRESLGRAPDPGGLQSYYTSNMDFEKMRDDIKASPEYISQQTGRIINQGGGGGRGGGGGGVGFSGTPYQPTPFAGALPPASAYSAPTMSLGSYTPATRPGGYTLVSGPSAYTPAPRPGAYTPVAEPGAFQPTAGPTPYQAAALPGSYQAAALPGAYRPTVLPGASGLYTPAQAPRAYQAADINQWGPQSLGDISAFQEQYLNQLYPGRSQAVTTATQRAQQLLESSGNLPEALRADFLENVRAGQNARGLIGGIDPYTEAKQLQLLAEQVRSGRENEALQLLGAQLGGPSFGELGNAYLGIGAQGLQESGLKEQQAQFGFGSGLDRARLAEQQAQYGAGLGLDLARLAEQQSQFGFGAGMDLGRLAEQQAQFGYGAGLDRARLAEQQAQFGYGASLDAARLAVQQAQFGAGYDLDRARLAAQQAQFGAGYGLDQARLAEQQAQFGFGAGLDTARFNAQQAQFGVGYGLDQARLAEQQAQFGAGYGLDQARLAVQNAQFAANLGEQQRQFGAGYGLDVARFNDQQRQFQTQSGLGQAGLNLTAFGMSQEPLYFQKGQTAGGQVQRPDPWLQGLGTFLGGLGQGLGSKVNI